MKIKTNELIGLALDWAAAQAEGRVIHDGDWYGPFARNATLKISRLRSGNIDCLCFISGGVYQPSENWRDGGPIIDREGINLNFMQFDHPTYWTAHIRTSEKTRFGAWAADPLIAAMRCYVTSKLGEEVDVPEEILK